MLLDADPIAALWSWVAAHASSLTTLAPSAGEIEELGRLVDALGPLDWELGPDPERGPGARFFALSPRGRRAALERTRQIVDLAPALAGWRFLPAKPARLWALRFVIVRDDGEHAVDGTRWQVVAHPRRDGVVDLRLAPPPDSGLTDDEAACAAIILVDGELGELERLEQIGAIEVVAALDEVEARVLELGRLRLLVAAARAAAASTS